MNQVNHEDTSYCESADTEQVKPYVIFGEWGQIQEYKFMNVTRHFRAFDSHFFQYLIVDILFPSLS